MSVGTTPPTFHAFAAFRRFSVPEYHRLIQTGILTDEDKVELLNGYVVHKTPQNPPHDSCPLGGTYGYNSQSPYPIASPSQTPRSSAVP